MALTFGVVPAAHAERTLTATAACGELLPGGKPIQFGFFGTEISCVIYGPQNVEHPMGDETLRQAMGRVYPGSYQVSPADPWSAWVVP